MAGLPLAGFSYFANTHTQNTVLQRTIYAVHAYKTGITVPVSRTGSAFVFCEKLA